MHAPSKPRYLIVTAENRVALVAAVDPKLADNVWKCLGAPFYDAERREWCQSIVRTDAPARNGEVQLREVKRR